MGAYGPPAGFYRNSPRVKIDADYCTGCLKCVAACPLKTVLRGTRISMPGRRDETVCAVVVDAAACAGCGRCMRACPTHAIGIFLV